MGIKPFDECYQAARIYSSLGDVMGYSHLRFKRIEEQLNESRSDGADEDELYEGLCKLNEASEISNLLFLWWRDASEEYKALQDKYWDTFSENEKKAITRAIF